MSVSLVPLANIYTLPIFPINAEAVSCHLKCLTILLLWSTQFLFLAVFITVSVLIFLVGNENSFVTFFHLIFSLASSYTLGTIAFNSNYFCCSCFTNLLFNAMFGDGQVDTTGQFENFPTSGINSRWLVSNQYEECQQQTACLKSKQI